MDKSGMMDLEGKSSQKRATKPAYSTQDGLVPVNTAADEYGNHIVNRMTKFPYVLVSCAWFMLKLKPIGKFESYLTDHAHAQIGEGKKFDSAQINTDAAHIINTTFDCVKLVNGATVQVSQEVKNMLAQLQILSASTLLLSSSFNRGPDKIFDNIQTDIKNDYLKKVQSTKDLSSFETLCTTYRDTVRQAINDKISSSPTSLGLGAQNKLAALSNASLAIAAINWGQVETDMISAIKHYETLI